MRIRPRSGAKLIGKYLVSKSSSRRIFLESSGSERFFANMKEGDKVRFKEGSRLRVTSKIRPDEIGEITGVMKHPSGDERLLVHVRFPSRDVPAIPINEMELADPEA